MSSPSSELRASPPLRLKLGASGEFVLDLQNLELRRGDEAVALEPRPFELLVYLVQHRDRLIAKDELLDCVWPGVAVSDTALSTALKHVRRALGDRGSDPHWIESRRGRGYRFVAPAAALGSADDETPTVDRDRSFGRKPELETLHAAMRSAVDGQGRMVLLSGEPGIGKSFLIERLLEATPSEDIHLLRGWGRTGLEERPLSFWEPIARADLAIDREAGDTASAAARDALEQLVSGQLDPDDLASRNAVETALVEAVQRFARRRPTVLVFEDVDLVDRVSLRVLERILPELPDGSCLVIGTLRTSRPRASDPIASTLANLHRHPWCALLRLDGLDADAIRTLAEPLGLESPSEALVDRLRERTAGNPFQLGALISDPRGLAVALEDQTPPDAVRDEVRGRLASLGPARTEILGAAATGSESVGAEYVAFAAKCPVDAARDSLAAADRSLLGRLAPDGDFLFASPLVREAIYAELPPDRRVEIHRRVGHHLEDPSADTDPLAWMQDGDDQSQDWRDTSFLHVRRGFDALGHLDDGRTRDQFEIELHMTLARAMARSQGWGGETLAAWQRAGELCARHGEARREGIVRFGLAAGLLSLGRMEEALHRYDEILVLGDRADDRMLQVAGCVRAGPLLYLGRAAESVANARNGLGLVLPSDDFGASGFSEDCHVTLRQWLGWSSWFTGETDAGRAALAEAVALARGRDSFALAYSLMWSAVFEVLCEQWQAAARLASESLEVATSERYAVVDSVARMVVAMTEGMCGDAAQAARSAQVFAAALGGMGDSGNRSGAPLMMACLARVQIRAGLDDDASRTIALGLALAKETGRFVDAELLRLDAELAERRGEPSAGRDRLEQALALAQAQGAVALERRVAASMRASESRA
ncbi:MAG: AAA family ATPase [bacterium]|nr:AAA family ATPase [bacterium]